MQYQEKPIVHIEIIYSKPGLTGEKGKPICAIKYSLDSGRLQVFGNITVSGREDYNALELDVLGSKELNGRQVEIHLIAEKDIRQARESELKRIAAEHNNAISQDVDVYPLQEK